MSLLISIFLSLSLNLFSKNQILCKYFDFYEDMIISIWDRWLEQFEDVLIDEKVFKIDNNKEAENVLIMADNEIILNIKII